MQLDAQPGRTAVINGKQFLFFSGYAYLGMHQSKEFIELVKEGTEKYGWSFPSSRISNTRLHLFDAFEEQLSTLTGFNNTVTVANGFTAGRMAVQLFTHKANFFIAPNAHPAVSEGLPKYKDSYENWKSYVINSLNEKNQYTLPVIISDSVSPLKGIVNDLSFLQYIEKKCVCIIDDSHGIGLIGENGRGISEQLPQNPHIDYVLVYSLSKAFNLNGGAISTNNKIFVDQLKQMPAYTGGTAMNPALMYAFTKGQHIYKVHREQLIENVKLFDNLIRSKTSVIHPNADLPMFVFKNEVSAGELSDKGILISSFPYPDPAGKKVQRIVINALHTADDLERLANALE